MASSGHFRIGRGQVILGDFSQREILQRHAEGTLLGSDLCWQPGMADWEPIAKHFANDLPPPLPGSVSQTGPATLPSAGAAPSQHGPWRSILLTWGGMAALSVVGLVGWSQMQDQTNPQKPITAGGSSSPATPAVPAAPSAPVLATPPAAAPLSQPTPTLAPTPASAPEPVRAPASPPVTKLSAVEAEAAYQKAQATRTGKPLRYGESGTALLRQAVEAGYPQAMVALGECMVAADGVSRDLSGAAALYKRAAEAGLAKGQLLYGLALHTGRGQPADKIGGRKWVEKAAGQGDAEALFHLSFLPENPEKPDKARALELMQQAADKGLLAAKSEMGRRYIEGEGVEKSQPKGEAMMREGAEAGDAWSQLLWARELNKVSRASDIPQVIDWLTQAAHQGLVEAMDELALQITYRFDVPPNLSEALKWYQESSERGSVNAMNYAADFYRRGKGTSKDLTKALHWTRLSADSGDPDGLTSLGDAYRLGLGTAVDLAEARRCYDLAIRQDYGAAMAAMGQLLEASTPPALTEAVEWYRRAAAKRWADGYYYLAMCQLEGRGVAKDEAAAVLSLEKATESISVIDLGVEASFMLGNLYTEGRGVPKDVIKAYGHYAKAATADHPIACFRVWQMRMDETHEVSLPDDLDDKAVKGLKKSAELGYLPAQTRLGIAYITDRFTVAPDPQKGLYWLRIGADRKDPEAIYYIGLCHYRGHGLAPDPKEGLVWIEEAANMGFAEAQNEMGRLHLAGVDMPANAEVAVGWFKKSAAQNLPVSIYRYAHCQLTGHGMPQDKEAGLAGLRRAAEAGSTSAIVLLAWCYKGELGVKADKAEAAYWREKMQKADSIPHQAELGVMLISGACGFPVNPALAAKVMETPAEKGEHRCQAVLASLYAGGEHVKKDLVYAQLLAIRAAMQGGVGAQMLAGELSLKLNRNEQDRITAYQWFLIVQKTQPERPKLQIQSLLSRLNEEQKAEAQNLASNFKFTRNEFPRSKD